MSTGVSLGVSGGVCVCVVDVERFPHSGLKPDLGLTVSGGFSEGVVSFPLSLLPEETSKTGEGIGGIGGNFVEILSFDVSLSSFLFNRDGCESSVLTVEEVDGLVRGGGRSGLVGPMSVFKTG